MLKPVHDIDLARLDLNLLVLFDAVMSERHVGRAAARMFVTPSAVSHGLGRLRGVLLDPLFLRTPKGVMPTARALELAPPIADVLARVREVIATSRPFSPAASTRRFAIGGPDAVTVVMLPAVLAAIRREAPDIVVSVDNRLPMATLEALDANAIDLAIAPLADTPPRFVSRILYDEDFVIAAAHGHPFLASPTLARYCAAQHLVVSTTGDPHGLVDDALERRGKQRKVALTVPTFMLALAVVARTDLLAAMPRKAGETYAKQFGVTLVEAPLELAQAPIRAIATAAAMRDPGIAWLFDVVARSVDPPPSRTRRRTPR
jgi:DNA-binding transcriptional LysR family regulator